MLRRTISRPPELKTAREIAMMREAGKLVARALKICRDLAKPGVRTIEINQAVEALYNRYGAISLFKGYPGPKVPFPAVTQSNPRSGDSPTSPRLRGVVSDQVKALLETRIVGGAPTATYKPLAKTTFSKYAATGTAVGIQSIASGEVTTKAVVTGVDTAASTLRPVASHPAWPCVMPCNRRPSWPARTCCQSAPLADRQMVAPSPTATNRPSLNAIP